MDLSIIIVNYNVKDFLSHLLQSIKAATKNISTEIIVVDNASSDGSVEHLSKNHPEVTLISSTVNLGFSRANNLGLQKASGRYLLLLNPDTLVSEDTFDTMIQFMDTNPEAGLAGCKLLNTDGTLQLACRRGFPGPWVSFCKVTGLSAMFPKSRLFARYNLTYLDENETYEVDAISGAFMFIRKSVVDSIGGLDEQFFMYGEDLDWCYRVQKAGHKVFYVHTTKIIHYKGESTKRSNIDETRVFYNAMRLFVRKHFSAYYFVEILLRFAISIREFMAFTAKWKLLLVSVFLDAAAFNIALFSSANVYESIRRWQGFDANAIGIVYSIPVIIQLAAGFLSGLYNKEKLQIIRTFSAISVGFLLLSSVIYFSKDFAYSRAVLLMTYAGALCLFILWRSVLKLFFNVGNTFNKRSPRRVFIIGTDDTAVKVADQLSAKQTHYYFVTGLIGKTVEEIGEKAGNYPIVGSLDNLSKVISEYQVDEIIFATGAMPYSTITEQVALLQNANIEFKIAGNNLDVLVGKRNVALFEDISLVDLTYNITLPGNRIAKRTFDIGFSLVLLFVLPFVTLFSKKLRNSKSYKEMKAHLPKCISGEMSLVGPKPTVQKHPGLGKPGVTGYWFTEKEPEENYKKLDVFYGKNQSLWLDLEILTRTFLMLLKGE